MVTLCTSASCLDKQKILNDRNNYLQVSFNELKNQVGNKSYVLDCFRIVSECFCHFRTPSRRKSHLLVVVYVADIPTDQTKQTEIPNTLFNTPIKCESFSSFFLLKKLTYNYISIVCFF